MLERAPAMARSANIIAVSTPGAILLRIVVVFLVSATMSVEFDLVFWISISLSILSVLLLRLSVISRPLEARPASSRFRLLVVDWRRDLPYRRRPGQGKDRSAVGVVYDFNRRHDRAGR